MKLNEKIYTCRRRTGLSQEELAEKIGVSRQAVSKWECGEAVPEPAKLLLLARAFGVTTDWLLDDTLGGEATSEEADHAAHTAPPPPPTGSTTAAAVPGWIDRLPRTLGHALRRWGWLAGVYLAIIGLVFAGFGCIGHLMFSSFMHATSDMEEVFLHEVGGMGGFGSSGGIIIQDEFGNDITDQLPDSVKEQMFGDIYGGASVSTPSVGTGKAVPVVSFMLVIPNACIVIGVTLILGGIVLAVVLYRTGRREQQG
ncbi:MAG: helix-turn-helix transcriptional regulator [Clostridia bacterium]|nr:helix-turn-helix transcriptional regulator [Clostridia bacterium]